MILNPTIPQILRAVAVYYSKRGQRISVESLRSDQVCLRVARPRQIAYWLAEKLTDLSMADIGAQIGGREHSTIAHGICLIDALSQTDNSIRSACLDIPAKYLSAHSDPVSITPHCLGNNSKIDPVIRSFAYLHWLSGMTDKEMSEKSGVAQRSFYDWRNGRTARVPNINAALNVLGYELAVVKIEDQEEVAA